MRDATRFGPTPPQVPYAGAIGELLGSVRIDGDDILTANVWAPSDASGAPVLLWIHGGALERGTAALPLYDGTLFATAGIVFVSINYRLGSEGFSVLEGAPETSVCAMPPPRWSGCTVRSARSAVIRRGSPRWASRPAERSSPASSLATAPAS